MSPQRHLLTVQDGVLALKGEKILYISEYGEPDYVKWPFEDDGIRALYSALYDLGNTDNDAPGEVVLPDDRVFGEIVPCGFNPADWVEQKMKDMPPRREIVY